MWNHYRKRIGDELKTAAENMLRFVPSRVEGLPDVAEVVVHPDRLELLSAGEWVVVRFLDIARWYHFGWLWRPLAHLGCVRGNPCVAGRNWLYPPSARYFRFYTAPPMTVYMPDEPAMQYDQTTFRRMHNVIAAGGYCTFDLG